MKYRITLLQLISLLVLIYTVKRYLDVRFKTQIILQGHSDDFRDPPFAV